MGQALQRAWLGRGGLARVLWPLSLLYAIVVALRRAAYRAGVFKNVIAGGSGKTPIVRSIVEHLRTRGLCSGIVSRGHGRRTSDCREVRPDSDAAEVGDEPLLLARACGVPAFVARRRLEAARALLRAYPKTQVIVSDDGLQHHAMARDIEICVFDERGIGNGWLLPAGPLREPWPRGVEFVLRAAGARGIDGFDIRRRLAPEAIRADGTRIPLDRLRGRALTVLAGIAKPQAFFDMLRERGLTIARAI